jgi:hypothetical protein
MYGFLLLILAVTRMVVWLYVSTRPHLLYEPLSARLKTVGVLIAAVPAALYVFAILIANAAPPASPLDIHRDPGRLLHQPLRGPLDGASGVGRRRVHVSRGLRPVVDEAPYRVASWRRRGAVLERDHDRAIPARRVRVRRRPENVPQWNYAIVETHETSEGPVGVGTTNRQVRSVPDRREESFEVIELEPDRRFAIHGGLGPFVGTLTYDFEDVGGATKLTFDRNGKNAEDVMLRFFPRCRDSSAEPGRSRVPPPASIHSRR